MDRPKKFDDVLDECLERLLVKKETLEQCLQAFPEHSAELRPLLEMALAARKASEITPGAAFRERARYEFNEALLHGESRKSRAAPHFHWSWHPAWVTAVAVLVILSLVGSGTVAAAAGSMPDSILYPVKRAAEQVELTLTFSELGKAELQSRLADKRVAEIVYLTEKGDSEKIAEITESLNKHLVTMAILVSPPAAARIVAQPVTAPAAEQAPTTLAVPAPTTAPMPAAAPVEVPAPAVVPPAQAAPAAQNATVLKEKAEAVPEMLAAEDVSRKADEEDDEGKEERPKDERRAKLKTSVEDRAKDNIARLKALLETAPESAKPSLRLALETAEREYQKAVKALDD